MDAGKDWATTVRRTLREEGRVAAGGWPGTMTEARQRLLAALGLVAERSPIETERLARALYAAARDQWLHDRDPLPREDD